MSKRKALFSKGSGELAEPNTFIGGVGATTVTSAADYASLTSGSLSESDIENFQIDASNNVLFYVGIDYTLFSNSFNNDSNLTYFIDSDGKLTRLGGNSSFRDCANIEYIYTPNAATFGNDFCLNNPTSMLKVNLEGIIQDTFRFNMSDAPNLVKLDMKSMTNIGDDTGGTLNDLENLKYFNLESLNTISQGQFERSMIYNTSRFPCFIRNGSSATNPKFYINPTMGVDDRPAFTRLTAAFEVGNTITINGLLYTCVSGTPSDNTEFEFVTSSNSSTLANLLTAIDNDTRTGTDYAVVGAVGSYRDGNIAALYCTTDGVVGNSITVSFTGGSSSVSWTPFRYGNDVHVSFIDNKYTDGVTMVEVDNIVTVNTPTGLNASSVISTSFVLNFTEPTANANGTETYEVWVEETNNKANPKNYLYYQYVSGTGISITGLEPNTEYTVKVRTQDGQMQFSAFSDTISLSTQDYIFGPELIVNGGFDTDSDWAKGTSWTIADGKASCNGSGSLSSQNILTQDVTYQVSFEVVDYTSGNIRSVFSADGSTYSGNINSVGTYTRFITSSITEGRLQFIPNTNFVGSLDNVSVKELLN